MVKLPQTLRWYKRELYFLDQTKLPKEVIEEKQESIEQVWDSIKQLKVRGAPAIGVAGAYGLLIGIKEKTSLEIGSFLRETEKNATFLESARPTAVNLKWGLERMIKIAKEFSGENTEELFAILEH